MKKPKEYAELIRSYSDNVNVIQMAMNESYNQALSDFYYKLIVSSKYQNNKFECWSNKDDIIKSLKK